MLHSVGNCGGSLWWWEDGNITFAHYFLFKHNVFFLQQFSTYSKAGSLPCLIFWSMELKSLLVVRVLLLDPLCLKCSSVKGVCERRHVDLPVVNNLRAANSELTQFWRAHWHVMCHPYCHHWEKMQPPYCCLTSSQLSHVFFLSLCLL